MPFINKAGCECLNESDEHGFDNCLRKDMTFLESDCDEQVTERSGLVEIVSVCVQTRVHLMVSCLSFPDDHFFLPFYNFTSVLWPCQLTPFLCLFMPAALQRITELLDCPETWVEPSLFLSPFVHSWAAFLFSAHLSETSLEEHSFCV